MSCSSDSDKFYDWIAEAGLFNTVLVNSDLLEINPGLLTAQFLAFAADDKNRRETIISEFDVAVNRTAEAYKNSIERFINDNWFDGQN